MPKGKEKKRKEVCFHSPEEFVFILFHTCRPYMCSQIQHFLRTNTPDSQGNNACLAIDTIKHKLKWCRCKGGKSGHSIDAGREHRACHQCRSNFGVKGTKSCKNNSEDLLYLPVHTPIGVETGINFWGTSIAKPNHKNQPNSNPFRITKTRLDSNQEKAIHFQKSSQCIHRRKKQQRCIHRWPINTEATYESKEQCTSSTTFI